MVTLIWPDGQVQERHVQYLLDKTFFCNSCLSNEANAHSPPYTATLLGEIICNVKTGKQKKKNVYLYLRFYSHTPTVYTIFKISTMSYKILNQGWCILEWVYWCALNFHLILLGSTISQKDKVKQQTKNKWNHWMKTLWWVY